MMNIRAHATDNGHNWAAQYHPAALRPAPQMPLSAQLKDAAQTLAGQIESGAYSELMPHGRTDLRALSLTLASWADQVETMEIERLPSRRSSLKVGFWRWVYRQAFWIG